MPCLLILTPATNTSPHFHTFLEVFHGFAHFQENMLSKLLNHQKLRTSLSDMQWLQVASASAEVRARM